MQANRWISALARYESFAAEFFQILRESGGRFFTISKVWAFRPKLLAMQRPEP
jgi:hypothetical protein